MVHECFLQRARGLCPVRVGGQDYAAGAQTIGAWLVDTWRDASAFAKRCRGRHQTPPGANDHGVSAAEALLGAVIDRPHALGDRVIFERNRGNAGVALQAPLLVAIDHVVIAGIRLEAEPSVPVARVRFERSVDLVVPRSAAAAPLRTEFVDRKSTPL